MGMRTNTNLAYQLPKQQEELTQPKIVKDTESQAGQKNQSGQGARLYDSDSCTGIFCHVQPCTIDRTERAGQQGEQGTGCAGKRKRPLNAELQERISLKNGRVCCR